jgi:hypothetical protein
LFKLQDHDKISHVLLRGWNQVLCAQTSEAGHWACVERTDTSDVFLRRRFCNHFGIQAWCRNWPWSASAYKRPESASYNITW